MFFNRFHKDLGICDEELSYEERYLNPADINLPPGYAIEVFAKGLNFPVNMVFTDSGDMLVAESGYLTGEPRILRLNNNYFDIVAEDFNIPLTGINYWNGKIYASHRTYVTSIDMNGTRKDIIRGLPSNGDFPNQKVEFGPDGKMYFGQGAATNSGVVGADNQWVYTSPLLCDYPGYYLILNGQNFATNNILLADGVSEIAYTGAFSAYGVPNMPYETRKGLVKSTGSILRANPDGTDLELFCWGLRNAVRLKFDEEGRLLAANQGMDARGSRPVANASDQMYHVQLGVWYGWPDFTAGEPVTATKFTPEGGRPVEFLLAGHPNIPPIPFAKFLPNSTIMGFDINKTENFGARGDIYIAEFGSVWPDFIKYITPDPGIGHKVSKVNFSNGEITTFAINKSGFPSGLTREGGFGWLTDVVFGPDRAMYILDFGTIIWGKVPQFIPHTGVIWRVKKI